MNVWVPVITFLLGQLSLLALEMYRDRRATVHEQAGHDLATKERRSEFQRETLLLLQEWSHKFSMACVLEFYARKELEKQGDAPPRELLPPPAVIEAVGFMELYCPRIADGLVRGYADELAHGWSPFLHAASPDDEARAMSRGDELQQLLNGRIGQLLRGEVESSP